MHDNKAAIMQGSFTVIFNYDRIEQGKKFHLFDNLPKQETNLFLYFKLLI